MSKLVLISFLMLCSTQLGYGQKNATIERVEALIDSLDVYQIDSVTSHKLADKALELAKKSGSNALVSQALLAKAKIYRHFLEYGKASHYYDRAINSFSDDGDKTELAELYSTAGRYYYEIGDYKEAMKHYLAGLSICNELGVDSSTKAWLIRYIASVFKRQDDYDKALKYYHEAFEIFKKLGDIDGMSSCLNNIGNVYGQLDNDSLQLVFYKKALELAEANNSPWRAAIIMDNIGSIYSDRNDFETAMTYFDRSYTNLLRMEEPDYTFLSVNYQNRAHIYKKTNELDRAIEALQLAEKYILKTEKKQKLELRDIYFEYADIYAMKKDYEKAYHYTILYKEIDDSLHNVEMAVAIEEMQFQHDQEKLERQNASLKELSELEKKHKLKWFLVLGLSVLLLSAISIIIFAQKKKLTKAYRSLAISLRKEMELSHLKSRFVSMASHQFRTPLTVIKSNLALIELQEDAIDDAAKPVFQKIKERINVQIANMTSLMDQTLGLGKFNSGSIEPIYIETNLEELIESVISDVNEIQTDGRKSQMVVSGDNQKYIVDPILLKNAVSNLLSNAFKYSKDTAPVVIVNFTNEDVTIEISDKGIGIPAEELPQLFEPFYRASNAEGRSGTGLGTTAAKEFVEIMKGKLSVISKLNEGSTFIIRFFKDKNGAEL